MAEITTFAIDDAETPWAVGHFPTVIPWQVNTVTSAGSAAAPGKLYAAQDDYVRVLKIPRNFTPVGILYGHSATLGASCTITPRIGTTAIGAATSAGAKSVLNVLTDFDIPDEDEDRYFNLLVSGAAINATDTIIRVHLHLLHMPQYAA